MFESLMAVTENMKHLYEEGLLKDEDWTRIKIKQLKALC